MVSITNRVLSITRNREKKLVTVNVKCNINFTELEKCQMKGCEARWYKLKCVLWGLDEPDPDDNLFTFAEVKFFSAAPTNPVIFAPVLLGEGVLDEDSFPRPKDEVYAQLTLSNLQTGAQVKRNTNRVNDYF